MALAGKLDAAEQICRRVGGSRAQQADSLAAVANACVQARDEGVAVALFQRAVRLHPEDRTANVALADLALRDKDYSKALVHLQALDRAHPNSPDLLTAMAQTYSAMGLSDETTTAYRAARKAAKLPPAQLWDAARHAMTARRFEDAADALCEVLETVPNHLATLNDLGVSLLNLGRSAEAAKRFEQVIRLSPSEIPARLNLSAIQMEGARYEEAVPNLLAVRDLMPEAPSVRARLAHALTLGGRHEEALAEAEAGLRLDPNSSELHHYLGLALRGLSRHAEALEHFRLALARQPENVPLLLSAGNTELELGEIEPAARTFAKLMQLAPLHGSHHRSYSQAHRYLPDDPHIQVMEDILAERQIRVKDTIEFRFALGKAYDDAGSYAEAYRNYAVGNLIKRMTTEFDEGPFERLAAAMLGFRADKVSAASRADSDRPVFIVGMPRSGTTLVEQILSAHPLVAGLGERNDWQLLLDAAKPSMSEMLGSLTSDWLTELGTGYLESTRGDAGGALRSVDKMPSNFFYAGLIHLALPNAKIIHMRRDPLDTCLSCFFQLFTESLTFSYDLGELGRFYRRYRTVMEHWRSVLPMHAMLDVDYEAVVGDPEGQTRRILDFVGLAWDDACLQFHSRKSTVLTASVAQVRRPIYRSSIGRREGYEAYLGPLIREIGDCGPNAVTRS